MSIFTSDKKTVEYDWKEHVASCATCAAFELAVANKTVTTVEQRNQRHAHYDRVKWLAEKYPVNCAKCDGALEDGVFRCYHVVNNVRCGSTKLYYRAHQKKPVLS